MDEKYRVKWSDVMLRVVIYIICKFMFLEFRFCKYKNLKENN